MEEHYILAAADAVAVRIAAGAVNVQTVEERYPTLAASRVIDFEPWHPDSLAGLASIGYQRGGAMREPVPGLAEGATYEQTWRRIAEGHQTWWNRVAVEFPQAAVSNFFALMVSETGREVFDFFNGAEGSIQPVFDSEEFALARMFEVGLFPRGEVQPELLGEYAQRAIELAAAAGRELPGSVEIRTALEQTFGGYSSG